MLICLWHKRRSLIERHLGCRDGGFLRQLCFEPFACIFVSVNKVAVLSSAQVQILLSLWYAALSSLAA